MTVSFRSGRYAARVSVAPADLRACQLLRGRCFLGRDARDHDAFDAGCQHLMIEGPTGALVATARLRVFCAGDPITQSYTAQFYDLAALAGQGQAMLELGRFCVAPDVHDPDVVRIAWAALTRIVDAKGIGILFGCTSFKGTDPAPYARSFARLAARHAGPDALRPAALVTDIVRLDAVSGQGAAPVPSLLRSYLAMGGWVGDHAVIDRQMQTLHVFTCLDIAAVPPARARVLRAVAALR